MQKETKFYPLTKAQNSILIIEKFFPGNSFVNVCGTFKIKGSVDFNLLNQAANLVIKYNDALRIRIAKKPVKPLQYLSEYQEQNFELLDFSSDQGLNQYLDWSRNESLKSFNFNDSNLYYFVMVKFSENEGGFYIKCHHIINDAWSIILFGNQLITLYDSLRKGLDPEPANNLKFEEYVVREQKYLSSSRFIKDRYYWQEMISENMDQTLFDRGKSNSTIAKRKSQQMPVPVTTKLNDFCEKMRTSPFIVFASLIALYYWKTKGKDTVVIGSAFLNRSGIKEKNTIGMFLNNLPFYITIDKSMNYISFLNSLSSDWMKILRHGSYPYVNILKEYRDKHKVNGKLYDITLSFQNAKFEVSNIEYETNWHFTESDINPLSISINDRENKGTYYIDFDYLTEVLDDTEIDNIYRGMLNLLMHGLNNPEENLADLSLLSYSEEQHITGDFNNTNLEYPVAKSILHLFKEQVEKNPDNIALVFEEDKLTYRELDIKSSQLAMILKGKGIVSEEIIGLICERSFDMVIGILGILKAGGAYLPIDPSYPSERISYMLNDSNCRIVVTNCCEQFSGLAPGIEYLDIEILAYCNKEIEYEYYPSPSALAYVIYTSGSTGLPKGVMVEHRALNNFVHSINNKLKFPYKNIISLTTLSFDIFFLETLLPLFAGMTIIIASKEDSADPSLLLDLIERHRIEVLQLTPSRLKTLLSDSNDLSSLKNVSLILVGGEIFPESLFSRLVSITEAKIYNMYGPTETTIWSTIKELDSAEPINIGKPIGNTQIYILDNNHRPLPIGVPGEIYISGEGLARGYYNKPELTDEKFLLNPYNPKAKMYKTGDIGKWIKNGEIEYISRNDNQVKIKGFRIELGEIEKCLMKIEGIKEAIVISYQGKSDRSYLCAYISGYYKVQTSTIRQHLSKYLPEYMMPARFIWLQDMPQTPNGKLDRKALPKPSEIEENSDVEYIAPRDYVEQTLAKTWSEVLEVEKIGIDDDFFALGGDSLAVIEVLSGVIINDWRLSAQDFYEFPTIRKLSSHIKDIDKNSIGHKEDTKILDSYNIKHDFTNSTVYDKFLVGDVLLTGGTGFLGIHILKELLENFPGKVYCLIRGSDARKKLFKLFNYYFEDFSPKVLENKVIVVPGDISKKNFGLSDFEYSKLKSEISSVIHCAALVKHYGSYPEFEKVNVMGTEEVIKFCINEQKQLSHISTISVSGNYIQGQSPKTNFTENDLYIGQDYKNNVYVRSKFEAECKVINAMKNGLKASIFRIGILTGRQSDGKFQYNIEENAFYRKLKSIFEIRCIPESILEQYIEFSPVDSCARAITMLLGTTERKQPIYHLYNHKRIQIVKFLNIIREFGIHVKGIPPKDFADIVVNMSVDERGKEMISGIVTDLIIQGGLSFSTEVDIDSTLTIEFLSQLGFEWPDLNADYILKTVNYMNEVGFVRVIDEIS